MIYSSASYKRFSKQLLPFMAGAECLKRSNWKHTLLMILINLSNMSLLLMNKLRRVGRTSNCQTMTIITEFPNLSWGCPKLTAYLRHIVRIRCWHLLTSSGDFGTLFCNFRDRQFVPTPTPITHSSLSFNLWFRQRLICDSFSSCDLLFSNVVVRWNCYLCDVALLF